MAQRRAERVNRVQGSVLDLGARSGPVQPHDRAVAHVQELVLERENRRSGPGFAHLTIILRHTHIGAKKAARLG